MQWFTGCDVSDFWEISVWYPSESTPSQWHMSQQVWSLFCPLIFTIMPSFHLQLRALKAQWVWLCNCKISLQRQWRVFPSSCLQMLKFTVENDTELCIISHFLHFVTISDVIKHRNLDISKSLHVQTFSLETAHHLLVLLTDALFTLSSAPKCRSLLKTDTAPVSLVSPLIPCFWCTSARCYLLH